MPGELYQIYANKTAINEKRTAIKGSGFREREGYWSSREISSAQEYLVYLDNGNIDNLYKDNGGYDIFVLGFLALEY